MYMTRDYSSTYVRRRTPVSLGVATQLVTRPGPRLVHTKAERDSPAGDRHARGVVWRVMPQDHSDFDVPADVAGRLWFPARGVFPASIRVGIVTTSAVRRVTLQRQVYQLGGSVLVYLTWRARTYALVTGAR